ncbi:hypothetical protein C8R48DRAFT_678390 [Suillus tomentosus]|nr:hypothetical protein C8R48DRAFT_678390 [Suillus tomentosus]
MSYLRTITACLVAFAPINGFVDVEIHENQNHGECIIPANRYFKRTEDISKGRVIIEEEDNDTRTVFMVLYDKRLHGRKECPYLVMKEGEQGRMDGVERKDYMAIMEAVYEQVVL